MEGSHLPRGPHQRWTRVPPYQRGRTTRRNTRTRGLPRVGLRLRDRLAFVVVFVSPKGDVGRRRGREARVESSSEKREARRGNEKRRQPKGWTMMFLALEFFLPSPGLGCYLILSLSLFLFLPIPSVRTCLLLSLSNAVFPCFTWKKQVSANKGPRCGRQAWPG